MGNKGLILALVVILGILLIAIIATLVFNPNILDLEEKSSEKIKVDQQSAEVISFEEKVKEFADETVELATPCFNGLQYSLQAQQTTDARTHLNTCRTIISEQEKEFRELQTYAYTYSDKREIEVLEKDFEATENFLDFGEWAIEIVENANNISPEEAKRIVLEINQELQAMIFNIELIIQNYQDTYYYQEYLDTPEFKQQLAFAKGQADAFQRLTNQIV